ncbi:hypothetical protein ACFW1A_37845, partial [Kitasatospora sp. NPDC058965]
GEAGPVPGGPAPVDGVPPGGGLLPRRVRQANLAPQLRAAAAEAAAGDRAGARERSPEEARAAFSSFQRGFSRGRAEPTPVPPPLTVVPPPAPGAFGPPEPPTRRALAPSPVPPALPAAPSPARPAPAEGS